MLNQMLLPILEKLSALSSNQFGTRRAAAKPDFIVLIFIHYANWRRGYDNSTMQLEAVKNDIRLVLTFLRYRHGDKSKTWKFLLDFDCEFTDYENVTDSLPTISPTRDAILDSIGEVSRIGGSGLIYYGGHCENGPDGHPLLAPNDAENLFTYYPNTRSTGLRTESRSYLVAFDAQRIYGEDILACFPSPQDPNLVYTFVFDACASEALLASSAELGYRYDETGVHVPPSNTPLHDMQAQIVAVSAARRDEVARAVTVNDAYGHGALTHFLLRRLSKRFCFGPSPLCLAKYLNRKCAMTEPETPARQHPSIASRRPLTGAFKLLPKSSHNIF